MVNAIDLFHPEYCDLALPGGTTVISAGGVPCESLAVIEITRSGSPEFGWARLACCLPSQPDTDILCVEQIEDRFPMGTSISVCQPYNSAPPDTNIVCLPVFVGCIDGIETTLGSEGERVEIIAKDFSAILERITVYGQRVLRSDGSVVLLPGFETVFNPLGRGNAAAQQVITDGKIHAVFGVEPQNAVAWSCAEVINYLLSVYVQCCDVHWPSTEQLLALTEGQPVRDLDVTGLTLREALQRCCAEAGLQFRFVPRLAETGPSQAMVFYRNGCGRTVELNYQQRGESLSLSRTNVSRLHSRREFYPITRRYVGQGDFRVYEATMELVKAWDPELEDISYSKFSASTNPEFYRVKDVYRKWCLNEAGAYTSAPCHQGEPYDFSRIFAQTNYVHRRRRFWPALSTDAQGRSLGYLLQVSFDDGLHWWPYLSAFNNLLDECGVWLSSDRLDMDTWVAALRGVLRFRITASVVSDERLTCVVADGPVGSAIPVVDHVLTLPRRFRYCKVSGQSVLAGASGEGFGPPDEADDSAALHQFVRRCATASPSVIETIQVQTPSLMLHFQPGDRITTSPDSRDLLGTRRDNRSVIWIDRIHMDFRNQCTNLQLIRQRMCEG
jgi:hypothetical protein